MTPLRHYDVSSGGTTITIDIVSSSEVKVNGAIHELDFSCTADGMARLVLDGTLHTVFCKQLSESRFEIYYNHHLIPIELSDDKSKLAAQLQKSGTRQGSNRIVRAPMPGLVSAIEVNTGDSVVPGTGLLILEAMKMENEIRSTVKGTIRNITVKERTTVEKDQPLLEIEIHP